jgi:hypothetical protein
LPPKLRVEITTEIAPRFPLRLPSGASFHRRELLECFVRLNIIQTLEWAQNACADACERAERSREARLAELNAARTGGAVTGAERSREARLAELNAARTGGAVTGAERSREARLAELNAARTGGAVTGAELNAARTRGAVTGAVPDVSDGRQAGTGDVSGFVNEDGRQAGTGDVAGFNAQKVLTTAPPNGGRVNAQQVLDILDRELRSKEIAISDLFDRYAIRSRRAGAHRAGCMRVPTTASARPQVCERRAGVRNGQ